MTKETYTHTCIICHQPFQAPTPSRRYKLCSKACAYQRQLERNRGPQTRQCPVCGETFTKTTNAQKMCSTQCARERQAEQQHQYYLRQRLKKPRPTVERDKSALEYYLKARRQRVAA